MIKSEGPGRETYSIDPKTVIYINGREKSQLQSVLNTMNRLRVYLDTAILSSWIQWSSRMKDEYEEIIVLWVI